MTLVFTKKFKKMDNEVGSTFGKCLAKLKEDRKWP